MKASGDLDTVRRTSLHVHEDLNACLLGERSPESGAEEVWNAVIDVDSGMPTRPQVLVQLGSSISMCCKTRS